MRYTGKTPREEAISRAIMLIESAIMDYAEEAKTRRDKAVIRQLKKLSHQLRRKIGADPVYPEVE